jgi:hypothetical protein
VLDTAREDLTAYFAAPDAEPSHASGARLLIGNRSAKSRATALRHIARILEKVAIGPPPRQYALTVVLCPVVTKKSAVAVRNADVTR